MNLKKSRCVDCSKKIRSINKRCNHCAHIGINSNAFKHGKTLFQHYCLDCNKTIFWESKRCKSCNMKYLWKKKLIRRHTGKTCWNYKDGRSYENYPAEFTNKLREEIRQRDHNKCRLCGMTKKEHIKKYGRNLEVHHKDHDKNNNKKLNLKTLCKKCHAGENKSWY